MSEYHQFVDFINEQLILRGWKPIDLARAMGVNQGQVTKLLKPKNEKCEPTLPTLRKVAKAFDISVYQLTPYFVRDNAQDPDSQDGDSQNKGSIWQPYFPVEDIFGRSSERDSLIEYSDRHKLIFITGLPGTGKSFLAKQLHSLVNDKFEPIFLKCDINNPSIKHIVELARCFVHSQTSSGAIADVIKTLQQKRCLLILDNLDLEDQEHSQDYNHLLEQIAETEHKSCAIVTCQSLPEDYLSWEPRPKVMRLEGLDEPDAIQLLENEELETQADKTQVLIKRHGGNPAGLKFAAQDILDLYNGDVAGYLKHSTFFAGQLKKQIQGIFYRLSSLELELLYWLTLQKKVFVFDEIVKGFLDRPRKSIRESDIFDAVKELRRRSLLQTHKGEMNLFSEVQHCADDSLRRALDREISNINLDGLGCLFSLKLRHEQIKLRDRLSRSISEETLCQALNKLEDPSNQLSVNAIGYAIENLRYLLGKSYDNDCQT